MQKKQNKKLTENKKPKEEDFLDFSISKHARPYFSKGPDYFDSIKYKKENNNNDFWDDFNKIDKKITELGEKAITSAASVLLVSKKEHKASPYVVRLEEKISHHEEGDRSSVSSEKFSIFSSQESEPKKNEYADDWFKEVERLRKQASSSRKSSFKKVYVDLLKAGSLGKGGSKKSTKEKQRKDNSSELFSRLSLGEKPAKEDCKKNKKDSSSFDFSDLPWVLRYPLALVFSVLRWVFEFVLSIPLGFLVAFELVLKVVNFLNKKAILGARLVGKSTSLVVEQSIFVVIGTFKAMIAIPIKFAVIFLMAIYKGIIFFSFSLVWVAKSISESILNYFWIFKNPPKNFYKKILTTSIVCAALVAPVKFLREAPDTFKILEGRVLGATQQGYSSMASISGPNAQENIEVAREKFSQAKKDLDSLNILVRSLIKVIPQGNDAVLAINAGADLSEAASFVAQAISISKDGEEKTPSELLLTAKESLEMALPKLESATKNILKINPKTIPSEYSEKFTTGREILPRATEGIKDFLDFSATLLEVIGSRETKRYAVLFQNNNELRPSGGFIGSVAFVDIRDGKIQKMEIPGGGLYDFNGYLTEHVEAPKPLSLLSPRWEIQDSNWYPDWPTSAEKFAWFLEKSGEPSIDGIIAIQATTFEKLIGILGPIEFPEYQTLVTKENVLSEMQAYVEFEYDKEENQPKKYIAELAPKVLEKILASKGSDFIEILKLVKSEIKSKNVLVYFKDKNTNSEFEKRGFVPSMIESGIDYLSVVNANIGGGKTDGVIEETINQKIKIDREGNATAELEIVRKHNGDLSHVFEGKNNVDYVRVYAPLGSELMSFEGARHPSEFLFEEPKEYYKKDENLLSIEKNPIIHEQTKTRITQEFGKTVFGNWLQVMPGEVVFAKISYKLPFKIKPHDALNPDIKSGYSLLLQKQAGARPSHFSVSVEYPSEWKVEWKKSTDEKAGYSVSELGPGLCVFEGDLNYDVGFAILFGSKK